MKETLDQTNNVHLRGERTHQTSQILQFKSIQHMFLFSHCNILSFYTSKMQTLGVSLNEKFPTKLWRLINDSKINTIIWNHQGDGIIINGNLIENDFLSSNGFKTSKFSSFTRQLNLYGFRKSQRLNRDNIHHYFHPNFQRNQPELLPLLRRSAPKSRPGVTLDLRKKDVNERWRDRRNLDDTRDNAKDATPHNGASVLSLLPSGVDFLYHTLNANRESAVNTVQIPAQQSGEREELQVSLPRQLPNLIPEAEVRSPASEPLHDIVPGDWIMVKVLSTRKRNGWKGPHQVLQASHTSVMIAEGATWLDTSQFKSLLNNSSSSTDSEAHFNGAHCCY
uniref:HSF-type DNA-binding domain-containing protein n=2 Tax=Takifugu rubripes TaxID=31033 RepID=A0A674P066_TAKRU